MIFSHLPASASPAGFIFTPIGWIINYPGQWKQRKLRPDYKKRCLHKIRDNCQVPRDVAPSQWRFTGFDDRILSMSEPNSGSGFLPPRFLTLRELLNHCQVEKYRDALHQMHRPADSVYAHQGSSLHSLLAGAPPQPSPVLHGHRLGNREKTVVNFQHTPAPRFLSIVPVFFTQPSRSSTVRKR